MHCLTDFKNFARAELNLFEPLAVLLGRNGSGKTNLIEGVELLASLARSVPLNEITDVDRGGVFEVRGGLRSCIRFGRDELALRFNRAVVRFDGKNQPVDYLIEIAARGRNDVQLSAERLQIGDRVLFRTVNSGDELMKVTYDNFSRGRNPSRQISASRSVLSRYEEIIRDSQANNPKLRSSSRTVRNVRRYLRNSYIFDPQPKAMREYARVESNPSRIVVEEFDKGLHPSRAKLLVGALSEAANRRQLNVLVTTHNPAFMDALDESQMDEVLVCHGHESGAGSQVARLGDMDIAGTVGLRGGLGDFVTRGALEEHLAPNFAERRSREAREWLASLT